MKCTSLLQHSGPRWAAARLLIGVCMCASLRSTEGLDTYASTKPPRVVAFGSCNKQDIAEQPFWDVISAQRPDAFLWMGDVVYAPREGGILHGYNLTDIERAYTRQLSRGSYERFRTSGVWIDGTWDDNDYGVNDGDKHWALKDQVQKVFLDFLDVPANSPRRQRSGVYHSHQFGEDPRASVRVIFLDTRYHRERYGFGSLGRFQGFPYLAYPAAALRCLRAFLGVSPTLRRICSGLRSGRGSRRSCAPPTPPSTCSSPPSKSVSHSASHSVSQSVSQPARTATGDD
eukprot:GHVU01198140.1.p1 GENE.GHVU01198140.1~~GHVU01198140.1.p1  ORF type:complete len:287 (+),score=32.16 GHVU01198140.1:399-1259(+)